MKLEDMSIGELRSLFCGAYWPYDCENCPASEYSPAGPQCVCNTSAALMDLKILNREVDVDD